MDGTLICTRSVATEKASSVHTAYHGGWVMSQLPDFLSKHSRFGDQSASPIESRR